jgi:hypothetical protein
MTPKTPFGNLLEEAEQTTFQGWSGISSHLPPDRMPIGEFYFFIRPDTNGSENLRRK